MTISIKHLENLPAALRRLRNEQTLIDDDAPLWKMTDAVNTFFKEIGYGDSIADDPPGFPRRSLVAEIEKFNDGTGQLGPEEETEQTLVTEKCLDWPANVSRRTCERRKKTS